MSAYTKKTCLALLTGFLLWVGLSPQVARFLYEAALMPRLRCSDPISSGLGEELVQPISFVSEKLHKLEGRLYVYPDAQKLMVYFGGRRSNFHKNSFRAEALLKTGLSVLIFEYRGFGEAPGRATSKSILEDGLAAYDAVVSLGYAPENIVLYGESLGVAVASYVCSKRQSSAVILQSGFGSLDVQIRDMIPPLRIYPRFMFPRQNLSAVASIAGKHPPLLILHGDHDPVVRKKHAFWLASAAGPDTTLVILHGATHGEVYERQDWFDAVDSFLASLPVQFADSPGKE